MGVTLEMVSPDGAARLARSHQACFEQSWSVDEFSKLLENPAILGVMLCEDKRDIGMSLIQILNTEAEILTFGVHRKRRGNGFGYHLLQGCCNWVQGRGAKFMVLEVSSNNIAAKHLYFGFGFEQVGLRKAYYADQSDALICRMALPG